MVDNSVRALFIDACNIGETTLSIHADQFIMAKSETAYVNYDGRMFVETGRVNTLIAAARALCDNVETVGTHNRIATEHLDVLRKALDEI